jgi:hypothetical protein
MKTLPRAGQEIYIVWYDDDEKIWQIDDSNICAGTLPLMRNKVAYIQMDLPREERNLNFINTKFVFTNSDEADAEAARLNKQA